MRERPILFSAAMVRAIRTGAKTQTRRLVKLPSWVNDETAAIYHLRESGGIAEYEDGRPLHRYVCPYGWPGDRLWVREAYALLVDPGAFETWDLPIPEQQPTARTTQLGHIPTPIYRADGERPDVKAAHGKPMRWRPGIHMPRWASRITLDVVDVRVERLHNIREQDARAEGFHDEPGIGSAKNLFLSAWEGIYGRESLDANPWVWAVEFRPLASAVVTRSAP